MDVKFFPWGDEPDPARANYRHQGESRRLVDMKAIRPDQPAHRLPWRRTQKSP